MSDASGVNPKLKRQRELVKMLDENPFLTDKQLAKLLQVSVPTIRLDRLQQGIPELRERINEMARDSYGKLMTMNSQDIIGKIIHLNIGYEGISTLDTNLDMSFSQSAVVRGNYIFAQANSLAAAVVDAPIAMTDTVNIKFHRPVRVGEQLICKGKAMTDYIENEGTRQYSVQINTWSNEDKVFEGTFIISTAKGENYGQSGC